MTGDIIVIAIIVLIIGAATFYIIKAKKSGKRCIGCPDSSTCGGNCSSCHGSCGCAKEKDMESSSHSGSLEDDGADSDSIG